MEFVLPAEPGIFKEGQFQSLESLLNCQYATGLNHIIDQDIGCHVRMFGFQDSFSVLALEIFAPKDGKTIINTLKLYKFLARFQLTDEAIQKRIENLSVLDLKNMYNPYLLERMHFSLNKAMNYTSKDMATSNQHIRHSFRLLNYTHVRLFDIKEGTSPKHSTQSINKDVIEAVDQYYPINTDFDIDIIRDFSDDSTS